MNLTERDNVHLWHPLTQHKTHPNHLPIVKAKGSESWNTTDTIFI